MGKIVKMSIDRKNIIEMGKCGLSIYDSEKRTTGAGLPPSGSNIHVYITIIFKDLFL